MILVVFGGRTYGNPQPQWPGQQPRLFTDPELEKIRKQASFLECVLDQIHKDRQVSLVVQGGAPGADMLARDWARKSRVQYRTFYADWKAYKKAAGPIRNQEMADWVVEQAVNKDREVLFVSFPGGRGTADMTARAKATGLEFWEMPDVEV